MGHDEDDLVSYVDLSIVIVLQLGCSNPISRKNNFCFYCSVLRETKGGKKLFRKGR